MKHGFDFNGEGRVPDHLLLDVSVKVVGVNATQLSTLQYAEWKEDRLQIVISDMVRRNSMLHISHDDYLKLVHRLKAQRTVMQEIVYFTKIST